MSAGDFASCRRLGEYGALKSLPMKDVVGIGIIGAGFARTTQIPGFKNCEGARGVVIASAHREHAVEVAREFDIPHVADDWRGVIERDDVDLVSIVTPVVTHREITLAALNAGKHVLCEKPMAMNAEEAREMMELAREKNVLALIDHELRFLPGRQKVAELIRGGDVGELWHARCLFRSGQRADPNRPWNWWSDVKQGGGALGAIGSHIVDALRWLLNMEVSEVFGQLSTHVPTRKDQSGTVREVTTDDEANLLLLFDGDSSGLTGNASLSMVQAGASAHVVEIFGSEGAVKVDGNGYVWSAKMGDTEWTSIEIDRGHLAPGMAEGSWSRGFTAFSQKIIDALREGRTTVKVAATFEDGYRTQLVLDAARRSNERGCWEAVAEQQ
jgi:predicted dehydrogenase